MPNIKTKNGNSYFLNISYSIIFKCNFYLPACEFASLDGMSMDVSGVQFEVGQMATVKRWNIMNKTSKSNFIPN